MNSSKSVTVTTKRFLTVTSSKPIDPKKVVVQVQTAGYTSEPNTIALPVFWAYFMAIEEGLLGEGAPCPWDYSILHPADSSDLQSRWSAFIRNLITDTGWVEWIGDREEIRKRALEAHKALDINS